MNHRRLLDGLKNFTDFSAAELDALAGVLRPRTLSANATLFQKGDAADGCYIIADGRVRIALSVSGTAPALRGGASSGTAPALRGGASSGTAPALRGGASSGTAPALRGGASSGTAPALRGGASSGTAPALRGGASLQADSEQLAVLGRGEVLGQMALLDGGRRSATCIALEPTTVLYLGRDEFDLLCRGGSSFALKFLDALTRMLVAQLRYANRRLLALAQKRAPSGDPNARAALRDVARYAMSCNLGETLDEMEVVIPDGLKR